MNHGAASEAKSVSISRFCTARICLVALFATLFCGFCGRAQTQSAQNAQRTKNSGESRRLSEASELANENYEHLAAAPRLVQEVLLTDPALLVELKRLAIKEATDNGQIVEDSSLTDQAIFDRLDQDIKFRSLATRLLQRYGYLLPTFNPDSELAKQRDFILRERARRQVQVEAREDAEIDAEIRRRTTLETADNCGDQKDCAPPASRKARRGNGSNAESEPIPDEGGLSIPDLPLTSSPILRAHGGSSSSS